MSDYPHGHSGHSGWGCTEPSCVARTQEKEANVSEFLKDATVIHGEHSTVVTNIKTGGWVKKKDGALISVEAAQRMNRAQRRKHGIVL